jgi:DNA-directed RNA polymerase specialized sigma24 family protein
MRQALTAEETDRLTAHLRPLIEQGHMSECVDRRLVALPDDYRVALLLHDGYGLTNPEIARLLPGSVATIKIRVHRARETLRATLVQACDFEADERGEPVCEQR